MNYVIHMTINVNNKMSVITLSKIHIIASGLASTDTDVKLETGSHLPNQALRQHQSHCCQELLYHAAALSYWRLCA